MEHPLQVLHWFNPLIWLAFHRMRADRELACDALVLTRTHGEGTKDYGRAIVSLLERFSFPPPLPGLAGILENKSQLKRRMTMITRFKNNSYRWSPFAVALIVILCCISLPDARSGKAAQPSAAKPTSASMSDAQPAATPAGESNVFVDPNTGITFRKIKTLAGPNDVIVLPYPLELSPNGKFLLEGDGLGIVPLAGGKPFKLVDLHGVELGSWSPDGKKVAFRAWPGLGEGAIWVVRVDPDTAQPTAPPKKLVECPLRDRLRWTPDSERIIFRRDDKETKAALWWTVSINDGTSAQITDFSTVGIPSPDGENVAYSENPTYRGMVGGPGKPLWVKNTKGGPARKIDDGATPWCWSADSKWVCCYDRDRPCFVRIADGYKVTVTVGLNVPGKMGWPIPSSLDGKKMYFYRMSTESRRVLKVVSASGGPAYELGTQFGGGNRALIWSPDSQAVMVEGTWSDDNKPSLKALPLDGGKPILFRKDVSIPGTQFMSRLSPDCKNLLVAASDNEGADGPWDVWVVPVSWQEMRTTGPAVLVFKGWNTSNYGGPAYYAFWSPDGKRIALGDRRGSIYVVPAAGGDPVRLTTGSEARWFYWSPDGKMIAFVREGASRLVQVVSSTGGEAKTVCSMVQGSWPIDDILWSPDSQALIMMRDQDIVSVSIADGSTRSLVNMKDLGKDEVSVFHLSADGTTLAFFRFNTEGRHEDDQLFLLDMKSGKVNPLMPVGGRLLDYRWSPNGKWIASLDEEFYSARAGSVLWEMDVEEAVAKLAK